MKCRLLSAVALSMAGALIGGVAPAGASTPEVWSQLGGGPRHSSVNPYETVLNVGNVAGLRQVWATSAGAAVTAPPAVYNGVVYTGSSGAGVTAIKADTGAVLWHKLTTDFSSIPAVGSGNVFVSSGPRGTGASIKALSLTSGSTQWSKSFSVRPLTPVVTGGVVYVASNNTISALNASNGSKLWATGSLGTGLIFPPAVTDGVVYTPVGQKLIALNASSGAVKWTWTNPNGRVLQAYPVVADGNVYASPGLTGLVALDPATGGVRWSIQGSDTAVAAGGGRVYTRDNGSLSARDSAHGFPVWSVTGPAVVGAPAVANGVLYYSTPGGGLSALNAANGAVVGWVSLGTTTSSTAAVANGKVYVGSDSGKVFAFGL
jgi:outer membrane protein assembly factor BamB